MTVKARLSNRLTYLYQEALSEESLRALVKAKLRESAFETSSLREGKKLQAKVVEIHQPEYPTILND